MLQYYKVKYEHNTTTTKITGDKVSFTVVNRRQVVHKGKIVCTVTAMVVSEVITYYSSLTRC